GGGAGDQPQARRRGFDYLIVGAGFAGSVLAERLAAGLNKRVLVVDDHKLNRMVASEMLKKWGAQVHLAENGKEAVQA
ncbi:NAD(P)-binding protein, partial [Klebsiella pneumoniae]|uniref:NAD(P)-binding protein n=1 Tax=Klebsiella pneumoniae TaxID=573 RepID=UPI0022B9E056